MMNTNVDPGQYQAFHEDCGIVDFRHRTQIELTGTDRATFLHNLCTADIKCLSPGEGCEAFLTTVQGKVYGHGLVFCQEDSLVFETAVGQAGRLLPHFDRYLIREDVQLHDRSQQWGQWLLGGPHCATVLEGVLGLAPLSEKMFATQQWNINGGVTGTLRRVPMIQGSCFLLNVATKDTDSIQETLVQAGAVPCELAVFHVARIEAGWPDYGTDITEKNLPQEIDRNESAISFTKGCYLGQETVARLDALGHVNRKLVKIRFSESMRPSPGDPIMDGDEKIGEVTSAAYSPGRRSAIAMAIVRVKSIGSEKLRHIRAGTARIVS